MTHSLGYSCVISESFCGCVINACNSRSKNVVDFSSFSRFRHPYQKVDFSQHVQCFKLSCTRMLCCCRPYRMPQMRSSATDDPVAWASVFSSVWHAFAPYKNGWTDRGPVWGEDGGPDRRTKKERESEEILSFYTNNKQSVPTLSPDGAAFDQLSPNHFRRFYRLVAFEQIIWREVVAFCSRAHTATLQRLRPVATCAFN